MSPTNPADATIERLLLGSQVSSGRTQVGPLGRHATRLLGVLWSMRQDLGRRRGTDQIDTLRQAYRAAPEQPEPPAGAAPPPTPAAPAVPTRPPRRWRLHRLRCRSVRGIAPFGTEFEFSFDGHSTLLYGPNGSGKSSLLNAAVWVLTGRVVTDCEAEADDIPLYAPPSASGRVTKLCDWPVVHTLPDGTDPASAVRDCWAELHLSAADGHALRLRRSLGGGLEETRDGTTWVPCETLERHGITPLDLQLSVSAATVFGRRSLEASPDTRHLLSMMLGYDALEELGTLVTALSTNLTKTARAERDALEARREKVRAHLAALHGRLRAGHPLLQVLSPLAGTSLPPPEQVARALDAAAAAVRDAEAALASLLGIGADAGTPTGLGDALTAAVHALETGWDDLFPSFAGLSLTPYPEDPLRGTAEALAEAAEGLRAFEEQATARIRDRYLWWKQESAPGSKAGLLVQVAPYFHPEGHACPVCDQSIAGTAVEGELLGLVGASPDRRATLKAFFRDLAESLRASVPKNIWTLASRDPRATLLTDWAELCERLGPALTAVVTPYQARVQDVATALPAIDVPAASILPAEADAPFVSEAADFLAALSTARRGLAVAQWAAAHVPAAGERLTAILLGVRGGESISLLEALSRGKNAASDIVPIAWVRDALATVAGEMGALGTAGAELATLEEIRTALEALKPVGKYAAAEVVRVFDEIRGQTLDTYRRLYPHGGTVLVPSRLHLNKGRDKTVEAYLSGGSFEVPGQHVANAGMLRALALAFYFALLEKHPAGLGFVIMDDPILSLDDDHREAWSANVLAPALATTQVIVATHQRQFLQNCRADFQPGRLVELNPRTRSRQITYRPGDRLERAEGLLTHAWTSAPNELRKYREELLITLDAYSPTPFFSTSNLRLSLDNYAALSTPNPLAGANQEKIARRLREVPVARVLDPGSHALTEADVTEPMVRECLRVMRELDQTFRNELERLEALRLRELRSRALSMPPAPPGSDPPALPTTPPPRARLWVGDEAASWAEAIQLTIIGAAAAQTHGCVVDLSEPAWEAEFPPGGAVLVTSEALSPAARIGQWALLADPEDEPVNGDLAAVVDRAGNRFLRRAWSVGDAWFLEAINPTAGLAPVSVRKCECAVRKLIGVVFGPRREPGRATGRLANEWQPRQDFSSAALAGHCGITIEGTSLEPIASDEQIVLVGQKLDRRFDAIKRGSLAVVETDDDRVGSVIKRVFPHERAWLLVSPNPIEPRDPLVVVNSKVRAVWPVRGILFGVTERASGEE